MKKFVTGRMLRYNKAAMLTFKQFLVPLSAILGGVALGLIAFEHSTLTPSGQVVSQGTPTPSPSSTALAAVAQSSTTPYSNIDTGLHLLLPTSRTVIEHPGSGFVQFEIATNDGSVIRPLGGSFYGAVISSTPTPKSGSNLVGSTSTLLTKVQTANGWQLVSNNPRIYKDRSGTVLSVQQILISGQEWLEVIADGSSITVSDLNGMLISSTPTPTPTVDSNPHPLLNTATP